MKKTNKEIFSHIYAKGVWGTDPKTRFCSGSGSRNKVASQYIETVSAFIQSHPDIKTIVDIGCGDFVIGKSLLQLVNIDGYIGVDVVPEVVEDNAMHYSNDGTFGNKKVQFLCKDASIDDVPAGDLCTIRQVLQHLSNEDIQNVIKNVKGKFKYVMVTEHVAKNPHTPNVDKKSNGACRTGSGVYLDQAPYGLETEEVMTIPMRKETELRTILIKV